MLQSDSQLTERIHAHSGLSARLLMEMNMQALEGDIHKDLWILHEYAGRVNHVLELGVRDGVSTSALLAAQPERLVSVDLAPCINQKSLELACGRTQWEFIQGDSRKFRYPSGFFPELTFIDTYHTYDQLLSELQIHGPHTKFYIALHDTLSYGLKGEDGSEPGLMGAVREFTRTSPEWREELVSLAQNGFTVLRRRS